MLHVEGGGGCGGGLGWVLKEVGGFVGKKGQDEDTLS
jgi:hypothetical protein